MTFAATIAHAAPCAGDALRLLQRADPAGAVVVAAAKADEVGRWLRCDAGAPYDVDVAVHELVHVRGGHAGPALERYGLLTPDGALIDVPIPVGLFPRSEIGALLRPEEMGQHFRVYLVGDSGEQDLLVLLDELNAYTWSARTAAAVHEVVPLPNGTRISARDGVAVFLYWTTLYVRRASEAHPEVLPTLRTPEMRALVQTLWRNAEAVLADTCARPGLGIDDGWYLRQAYSPESIGWLAAIDAEWRPSAPAACLPLMEAAQIPRLDRAGEAQTVTVQTVTVVVDGVEMTLEEIERRARRDPRYADLLTKIRAEIDP